MILHNITKITLVPKCFEVLYLLFRKGYPLLLFYTGYILDCAKLL